MPSGAVKDHDDSFIPVSHGNFVKEYLHAAAVHVRQNKRIKYSVRRDGRIGISIFLSNHSPAERTGRCGTPASPRIGDTAETGFILEHQPDRPLFLPFPVDIGDESGEFFFHSS